MTLGELGWLVLERLAWSLAAFTLAAGAAWIVGQAPRLSPALKAWAWRLALLQAVLVLTFNLGWAIALPSLGQGSPSSADSPLSSALGAGLGAFWIFIAGSMLVNLGRSGIQTARMVARLPLMETPDSFRRFEVDFRLQETLAAPMLALTPLPAVVAPSWCWQKSETARLALEHEKAHLRRGDVQWQVLGFLAAGLLWVHPLARLAYRELIFWQECAADEEAIAELRCPPDVYAEALLKIVSQSGESALPTAVGLGMQAQRLGRRMEVVLRRSRRSSWIVALAAILLLAGALIPWRVVRSEASAVQSPPPSRGGGAAVHPF